MFEVKSLSVESKNDGKQILNDVSFEIGEKEIFSLLGVNGSGKTTLAKALLGIGEYSINGKIIFEGEDISGLPTSERAKKGITMAFQEPARFEGLTVRDFLLAGKKGATEKELKEILELVGIDGEEIFERKLDEKLSGGERKRIELASVIAMKPKLMILDEPDASLDIIVYNELYDILQNIREKIGCSILIITHREEAGLISDKAGFLLGGKLVETGTFRHVMRAYCQQTGRRKRCMAGRGMNDS